MFTQANSKAISKVTASRSSNINRSKATRHSSNNTHRKTAINTIKADLRHSKDINSTHSNQAGTVNSPPNDYDIDFDDDIPF